MRDEVEMVAYALEAEPQLLPWIPELLADFDELGSNAGLIVEVLGSTPLAPSSRVLDLGCGKGAVAVAIAKAFGCSVEGIELFEPFIAHCRERAAAAGVAELCSFRQADIAKSAGRVAPADVAVAAALGDVLGPLEETVGILRTFVRPGGHIVIADGFLKDEGASAFPGFEDVGPGNEMRRRLQSQGDVLKHEAIDPTDHATSYAREIEQIRRRAGDLAARRPDLQPALRRYVAHQEAEYAFMAATVVPVVWLLERGA